MKNNKEFQLFNKHGYSIKSLFKIKILKEMQNKIINSNHTSSLSNNKFNNMSIKLQNEIYKKKVHFKIVKDEINFIKKILKIKNISELMITSFFHLRAVKKQNKKKKSNFLGFHRETFYSDYDYTKHQINVTIPIMGYTRRNSMKIIEGSHKIPDEKIKTKKLNSLQSGIKKNSSEHKLGLAYNPKVILGGVNLKKAKRSNLQTGQIMFFSSNLIHGNGINYKKDIRYSIDFGLIKKKYLIGKKIKDHHISYSKNKKYWIKIV